MDSALTAAWVSAGAAVVQAVGAIAAIAYSGKLARDSAKREAAALQASQQREAALAAKTEERERHMDQAERQRRRAERDAPLRVALGLAERAVTRWQDLARQYASLAAAEETAGVNFMVEENRSADRLWRQQDELIRDAKDANSITALDKVIAAVRPEINNMTIPDAWANIYDTRVRVTTNAIEFIKELMAAD